jgi:hypothetical protein
MRCFFFGEFVFEPLDRPPVVAGLQQSEISPMLRPAAGPGLRGSVADKRLNLWQDFRRRRRMIGRFAERLPDSVEFRVDLKLFLAELALNALLQRPVLGFQLAARLHEGLQAAAEGLFGVGRIARLEIRRGTWRSGRQRGEEGEHEDKSKLLKHDPLHSIFWAIGISN